MSGYPQGARTIGAALRVPLRVAIWKSSRSVRRTGRSPRGSTPRPQRATPPPARSAPSSQAPSRDRRLPPAAPASPAAAIPPSRSPRRMLSFNRARCHGDRRYIKHLETAICLTQAPRGASPRNDSRLWKTAIIVSWKRSSASALLPASRLTSPNVAGATAA